MRESWHKGKMNFPKGIQGVLMLHVFIQAVICALVRTMFSSASQRAHANVVIPQIHETKQKILLYHPHWLSKKAIISMPKHLFLQLCSSILTTCPKMQIGYKFLYQQKESILLLLKRTKNIGIICENMPKIYTVSFTLKGSKCFGSCSLCVC